MKTLLHFKHNTLIATSILTIGILSNAAFVAAVTPSTTNPPNTSADTHSAAETAAQQQHLTEIKTKGDAEITRRLAQLNKLDGIISASTKLTSSNKTYLTSEVNTEISGLTALKTKLDGESTLSAAVVDAKAIFSDYRVYALVTPKIWLVKTADDQQAVESKLSSLSVKLQTRLTTAQNAGKNVSSLQSMLTDMNTQIKNAQTISSSIEQKVLPLQPSDFNSDHAVLSGDAAQLKTAHADNTAAYTDAKNIIVGLKNL